MLVKISSMAKSIAAAVATGSATFVSATADGSLSSGDLVTVSLAVLGALGIVYAVPNK